jgi:predicted CXXCH cytochrome family protein
MCHGPGQQHVDGMQSAQGDEDRILAAMKRIYSFRGAPAENSARCLECHKTTHEQTQFLRSEHKLQGVDCQTCHAPHATSLTQAQAGLRLPDVQREFATSPGRQTEQQWLKDSLLRQPQPALCFSCHKTIESQFALPNHHKVPEGLMKCTDCHNAHGTRNAPMLKRTNWEACVTCHAEKRGPFVFEHGSVKVEGCAGCHAPHGSVNRMMLVRREGRFLCLQCHVNPQADNVPHGRLGFTTRGECVRCHSAIHGSNFSEFFLN